MFCDETLTVTRVKSSHYYKSLSQNLFRVLQTMAVEAALNISNKLEAAQAEIKSLKAEQHELDEENQALEDQVESSPSTSQHCETR